MIYKKVVFAAVQLLFCLCMFFASIFFEYVIKLTPCALCLVQRFLIIFLIILALLTFLQLRRDKSAIILRSFSLFVCFLGIAVSLRHVWLQDNASLIAASSCLPDITFMLRVMPLPEVITKLFTHGGSECSKIKWSFLGLTMPAWVAYMYFIYAFSLVYSLVCERKVSPESKA